MATSAKGIKVTFQPLSVWQKPNCLFCKDDATQEAFSARGRNLATIRCCGKLSCKRKAAASARGFVRDR